jgi:hypothetical protein
MQADNEGESSGNAKSRPPDLGKPDNQAGHPAENKDEGIRKRLPVKQERKTCSDQTENN